jgi:hypothetical protein
MSHKGFSFPIYGNSAMAQETAKGLLERLIIECLAELLS